MKAPYNEGAALLQVIETNAVRKISEKIQKGEMEYNETLEYKGYLGEPVIGTLSVSRVGNQLVGLIIEVEEDEALKVIEEYRIKLILIALVMRSKNIAFLTLQSSCLHSYNFV